MSAETEVERLLDNFQRALDTLNNVDDVETLLSRLDVNRSRKLLKKVKHAVNEVHTKVGSIRDRVSRVYKKLKTRRNSESDDVNDIVHVGADINKEIDDTVRKISENSGVLRKDFLEKDLQININEVTDLGNDTNFDNTKTNHTLDIEHNLGDRETSGKKHGKKEKSSSTKQSNSKKDGKLREGGDENSKNSQIDKITPNKDHLGKVNSIQGEKIDNREEDRDKSSDTDQDVIAGTPESLTTKKLSLSFVKDTDKSRKSIGDVSTICENDNHADKSNDTEERSYIVDKNTLERENIDEDSKDLDCDNTVVDEENFQNSDSEKNKKDCDSESKKISESKNKDKDDSTEKSSRKEDKDDSTDKSSRKEGKSCEDEANNESNQNQSEQDTLSKYKNKDNNDQDNEKALKKSSREKDKSLEGRDKDNLINESNSEQENLSEFEGKDNNDSDREKTIGKSARNRKLLQSKDKGNIACESDSEEENSHTYKTKKNNRLLQRRNKDNVANESDVEQENCSDFGDKDNSDSDTEKTLRKSSRKRDKSLCGEDKDNSDSETERTRRKSFRKKDKSLCRGGRDDSESETEKILRKSSRKKIKSLNIANENDSDNSDTDTEKTLGKFSRKKDKSIQDEDKDTLAQDRDSEEENISEFKDKNNSDTDTEETLRKPSRNKGKSLQGKDKDNLANESDSEHENLSEFKDKDNSDSDTEKTLRKSSRKRDKSLRGEDKDNDDSETEKTLGKSSRKKDKSLQNKENGSDNNDTDTEKTLEKSSRKKNKSIKNRDKDTLAQDSDSEEENISEFKDKDNSDTDSEKTLRKSSRTKDKALQGKDKDNLDNESDSEHENLSEFKDKDNSDTDTEKTPKKSSKNKNNMDSESDPLLNNTAQVMDDESDKANKDRLKTETQKPMIKLVDISKLMAPNVKPLDVVSPKPKKSVTFDSSVIILSSSDEDTPKKHPKDKNQSPLKSAMRKANASSSVEVASDSDSKDNDKGMRNRRHSKKHLRHSERINRKKEAKEESDISSNSDNEVGRTRSKRLEKRTKNKFARLVEAISKKREERKTRLGSSESEEEWSEKRLKKKDRKSSSKQTRSDDKGRKKVLDSNSDNSDYEKTLNKNKKSNNNAHTDRSHNKENISTRGNNKKRKKDLLDESSLSDISDNSDSEEEDSVSTSKKRLRPKSKNNKSNKSRALEIDENDPKFKCEVYIGLPKVKCEDLQKLYLKKKEIFEIKRLTNMDALRRTRYQRTAKTKEPEKPENKRIKLTLKLRKRPEKKKVGSDEDDDQSSTENDGDVAEIVSKSVESDGDDDDMERGESLAEPVKDTEVENEALVCDVAKACLNQINDTSDKDQEEKQDSGSESDVSEKQKGNKKKKNKELEDEDVAEDKDDSGESGNNETKDESKQGKENIAEPKVNGQVTDSDDDNRKEKSDEKSDQSGSDEEIRKKKKNKKNWKNDKLLKDTVEISSSDDDFAKFAKKKDKSNPDLVRKTKKRMKKSSVISDSDSERDKDADFQAEEDSSDSSNSEKENDKTKEKEDDEKAPARRRIKRTKDSSSDEEDRSTRKQIRRMIDRDSLSETTKKAEQDEKERKARIAEKQKKYNQIFELKSDAVATKVVLDFDEKNDKPLLSVHKKLVKQLKPHQVLGVKFMWDASFESLDRAKKTKGSGCILAHCMGLGKTLQVIALSHTLLVNSEKTKVNKILVVCPLNTVLNWKSEFKKWMPNEEDFEVYELVSCKTSSVNHERNYVVREWHENGGVLIIGYNMFRTLSNPDNKAVSKKLRKSFGEGLVDPGPDLVVCDEGHLLKNEKTNLSIAMNRIKTARRIVLTGTPLQNNLREYWCMVQFIKPNLLGTYKEYLNRFVNPITNGQYTDSTPHDINIMRRRSHVLHKLLDGVVQRQDYGVLAPYLPPKHEYILFVQLTEVQAKLYKHYIENFARKGDGSNRTSFLFADFQALQRICTHPRVLLFKSIEERDKVQSESDSEGSLKDFIDDGTSDEETSASETDNSNESNSDGSTSSVKKKKKKGRSPPKKKRVTRAQAAQRREDGETESDNDVEILETRQWWQEYIDKDEMDNINHSAKIFLLFEILRECEEIGDKVLVFSQSLYTLNCLEYFLQRIDEATQKGESEKIGGHSGSWAVGLDYFRLDGSSSCDNRANWCDQFNDPDNTRARLFLISTKAGGLGINLVAANRVIIFDVSWNPSHDIQSIYRVYRFGQTKPCYIYRFVSFGAMEMKIYERQVTKQAISKRVIDEQQIDRHYSQNDIQELYNMDLEPTDRPIPLVPKDVLLGELLQKYEKTIFKYHEHQSLLENKEDEVLNEDERKAAWEEFENEKIIRKTTTNYPVMNLGAFQNALNFSPHLIQLALANIVQKDNPTWSEVQIRGILPALVQQLQMQMSENDFSMYNRVQQEIRLIQMIETQRLQQKYFREMQMRQMLQKQQLQNQLMGNLNITPEQLRRIQLAASQNFIPPPARSVAGGSGDVIELND